MFSPYLDGRLTSLERDRVLYHIEICGACHRELQSLERTVNLLRRMPMASASRSFTLAEAPKRSVLAGIGNSVWLRAATAATVIVLCAVLAIDFTGALDDQDSQSGSPVATEAQEVVPTMSAENGDGTTIASSPLSPGENDAPPAATVPEVLPGTFIGAPDDGLSGKGIEQDGNAPPAAMQKSTDSSSHSPAWIRVAEIASGSLTIGLVWASLLAWQRRRRAVI